MAREGQNVLATLSARPVTIIVPVTVAATVMERKKKSKKGFPSRKRKMVSSPPSLKRTRTSKVLGEKGFEINWGKWTIVEACLLETVESFLCTTNVLPTYQNITKLYNFVANSNCASHLNLNVNPKTEKQVLGKLNFKHSRHGVLENLFYGLS